MELACKHPFKPYAVPAVQGSSKSRWVMNVERSVEGEQPLCRKIYKNHDEICFHILYHLIYDILFYWSVILRRGISEAKSDSLDVEC